MASYYSLICWGGTAGKTVSLGASSTITLSTHLVRDKLKLQFTSGSPPTGVSLNTPYYCKYVSSSTFKIYSDAALTTQVTWSGSGPWSLTAKSDFYLTGDLSLYSTRIYDGVASWDSARGATSLPLDVEYVVFAENGGADRISTTLTTAAVRAQVHFTTLLNGSRTNAWHGAANLTTVYETMPGFVIDLARSFDNSWVLNAANVVFDGLSFYMSASGSATGIVWGSTCIKPTMRRCVMVGSSNSNIVAVLMQASGAKFYRNLIRGFTGSGSLAFNAASFGQAINVIANNVFVGNYNGVSCGGAGDAKGLYVNNISVGNSNSNWSTQQPTSIYAGSGNNYGEQSGGAWTKGTPWYQGSDTGKAMATTDFKNYSGFDLRPKDWVTVTLTVASPCEVSWTSHGLTDGTPIHFATDGALPTGLAMGTAYYSRSTGTNTLNLYDTAAHAVAGGATGLVATTGSQSGTHYANSAPQVDSGLVVLDIEDAYDIAGNAMPNYSSLTPDGGAYEGLSGIVKPVVRDLVLDGPLSGSQAIIYSTGTTGAGAVELQRNNSTSGNETYHAGAAGVVVDIVVYKLGYDPIRLTGISLDAETTTIKIQQARNRAWVASSGLAYTTDLTFTVGSPNILKARIASPLQNYLCLLYEAYLNSATNTALRNIDFPVRTNGPNSFDLVGTEWRGWSTAGTATANTSLNLLSRDGMRYLASDGVTVNAVWTAYYTPDTPAGMQVKYKQSSGGSVVSALATGPIDQLIQVYGGASYGAFDYTGFMEMRAPAPGYSQPKVDFHAIYGAQEDQLNVAGLKPVLQWATTNADIDAAHLVLNNTAKTFVVSASHSVAELYQRSQWWANQDAQWSADIPLTSTDGNRFALATGWTLSGLSYVTGAQTLVGGTLVLDGPGTYAPGFDGNTVVAQGEGTYTFTANGITLKTTPTADNVHYVLSDCTLTGTLTVQNQNAHPIVVEVPAGVTTSTTGNTGGAITFVAPILYQSVTVSNLNSTHRVQLVDLNGSPTPTELYNGVPGASSYTWTDTSAASADRAIRLRVMNGDSDPAAGIIIIDTEIGTCGTLPDDAAVTYRVNTEPDTVYAANAVDGATVTGIVIDDASLRLEIDSGTIVTYAGVDVLRVDVKKIYAYETYWLGTEEGIRDESRFIDAIDPANYEVHTFKLLNNSGYPVLIVGGYLRDAATGIAATLIDYAGGPIHFAPDHVVNNVVTVSGVNVITGDKDDVIAAISGQVQTGMTAQGYTATRAAKLDNLDATVSSRLASAGYTAPDNTGIANAAAEAKKARQAGWNRMDLDKATGVQTLKDDDGSSNLATRQVWIDRPGNKKYDGTEAPHSVDAFA